MSNQHLSVVSLLHLMGEQTKARMLHWAVSFDLWFKKKKKEQNGDLKSNQTPASPHFPDLEHLIPARTSQPLLHSHWCWFVVCVLCTCACVTHGCGPPLALGGRGR